MYWSLFSRVMAMLLLFGIRSCVFAMLKSWVRLVVVLKKGRGKGSTINSHGEIEGEDFEVACIVFEKDKSIVEVWV